MSGAPPFDDEITRPIGPKSTRPPPPVAHTAPRPLSHQERCHLFGRFAFTPTPTPGNPEGIVISDGWDRRNLVNITLPWQGKRIWVHRLIADQVLALWQDWADAKLLDRVVSFDGSFVARYKRGRTGSEENLSNHSWGTAFDINAKWNRLGHPPAPLGTTGCVLELLPFAERHGMLNGSTFGGGRIDAMHFEAYRVIAPAPRVA